MNLKLFILLQMEERQKTLLSCLESVCNYYTFQWRHIHGVLEYHFGDEIQEEINNNIEDLKLKLLLHLKTSLNVSSIDLLPIGNILYILINFNVEPNIKNIKRFGLPGLTLLNIYKIKNN